MIELCEAAAAERRASVAGPHVRVARRNLSLPSWTEESDGLIFTGLIQEASLWQSATRGRDTRCICRIWRKGAEQ